MLRSDSPDETERIGRRLAGGLARGTVVLLRGELGAGKTVLARGIARGLGVTRRVASPTYTYITEYREAAPPLFHMDLYRLLDTDAGGEDLGVEDYLGQGGVVLIEWPEAAPDLLPAARLEVTLEHAGEFQRRVIIRAEGATEAAALTSLREALGAD